MKAQAYTTVVHGQVGLGSVVVLGKAGTMATPVARVPLSKAGSAGTLNTPSPTPKTSRRDPKRTTAAQAACSMRGLQSYQACCRFVGLMGFRVAGLGLMEGWQARGSRVERLGSGWRPVGVLSAFPILKVPCTNALNTFDTCLAA